MALTQSQIEAQLATLYSMRTSGVSRTKHGETEVQFRSLAELEAAIAELERQLALLAGSRRGVNYIYQSGKGL